MYKLNLQYWNKEKLASIVFVIVGLLMGRVVLFGGINGCAIGYLTCFLFNKNIFYAVAVTIFTGLMTVRKTMDIGEYVIAIVLMCLFNFLGNGRIQENKKYFIGGLSLLSGALIIAGFTGNFVYYCIIGTLEAIFTVVIAYVLDRGIGVLRSNGKKEYIDGEEILSLFILGVAVICGSGNMVILGVPPALVAVVTVIFVSSVKGGCILAIASGATTIPDLIPVLSVLAALAEGETVIEHAGRLRLKESDRLASTAAMLSALGGQVTELPEGLCIQGMPQLAGGTVDACNDHRIAMAAAVAAGGCRGNVVVRGSECVNKSYPDFWRDLDGLKGAEA